MGSEWQTFIGAIIGAAGSILGGLWATRNNIKNLRKETEKQRRESERVSISVIYNDITGLLREMIYYSNSNSKEIQGLGSHNPRFADHIAILKDVLSPEEQYNLHRIYGIIIRYQNAVNTETSNLSELSKYEIHLSKVFEFFTKTVFGGISEFKKRTENQHYAGINIDLAIDGMKEEFKRLYLKIENLQKAPL